MPVLDDFSAAMSGARFAADLERIGSPVTRADLEKFRARIREPLSVKNWRRTLYNTPPLDARLPLLMISRCSTFACRQGGQASSPCTAWSRPPRRLSWCAIASLPSPTDRRQSSHFLAAEFLDFRGWQKSTHRKFRPWPRSAARGRPGLMGARCRRLIVSFIIALLVWPLGACCRRRYAYAEPPARAFRADPKALNRLETRSASVPLT